MKIEMKQVERILKKEDILGYGGHSIVYKAKNNNTCLKVYRDKLSNEYRDVIKANYIDLTSVQSLRTNPYFLTPIKLSTNQYGILQSIELPRLPYANIWGIRQEYFMTEKYLTIAMDMIKIIKKLTNKGIVITDLKLSNMLVNHDNKVIVIDNDFSIRSKNQRLLDAVSNLSKNVYMNNYKDKFSNILDENYNKYMLVNMMALLLIEKEELETIWPKSSSPSYATIEAINRAIQTDRSISQSFKKNIKNNLIAINTPDISQNTIDDYQEIVLTKIKKHQKNNRRNYAKN